MSRVKLCDAWQIAFNRLLYYASFLEERPVKLDPPDIEVFKKEFTVVSFTNGPSEDTTNIISGMICSVSSLRTVQLNLADEDRRARPNSRPTGTM